MGAPLDGADGVDAATFDRWPDRLGSTSIRAGATGERGVEVVVRARDPLGEEIPLTTVIDPEHVSVFAVELGDHGYHPDADVFGFELLALEGYEWLDGELDEEQVVRFRSAPAGRLVVGARLDLDELADGWGMTRGTLHTILDADVRGRIVIELDVYASVAHTIHLERDPDLILAHPDLVLIDAGTGLLVPFDRARWREVDGERVLAIEFERAPLGELRLFGRTDMQPIEEGTSARRGFIPSGIGALVDARVTIVRGGPATTRVAPRTGAILRGRLPIGHERVGDWIPVAPVDGNFARLGAAYVHAYVFPADEDERAAGIGGTWYAQGLLPGAIYRVGEGGREVAAGAEGSTKDVELTDEDFAVPEPEDEGL